MCCKVPFALASSIDANEVPLSADDKSNRYVAQDNIVATDDEPTDALMKLAGRFFLRYDKVGKRFVSNMLEEYPDD